MGQRESLRSIAGKQAILEDELTRLVRCHDLLKMTRSTGVDEVGRLRGDIAAYLEKT